MIYVVRWTLLTCCAVAAHFASIAFAQEYPTKPIRIIVAGGPDNAARIVGQKLTDAWGLQVVIDNRPGAGGQIGAEMVAKGQPDGYLLLMFTTAHTINATLQPGSYDLLKDFAPVIRYSCTPEILVVHPSLPVHTVKELIALAKAKPGQINFASAGNGTPLHLGGEMFKHMAGINIVHVPYKGASQAMLGLIGGQIDIVVIGTPTAIPQIQGGKVRALAVLRSSRLPAIANVPTAGEAGFPGYEVTTWYGVLVPAGTSKDIVARLNTELAKVMTVPASRDRIVGAGFDPMTSTPQQFAEFIKAESLRWGKVIKDAGIRAE